MSIYGSTSQPNHRNPNVKREKEFLVIIVGLLSYSLGVAGGFAEQWGITACIRITVGNVALGPKWLHLHVSPLLVPLTVVSLVAKKAPDILQIHDNS